MRRVTVRAAALAVGLAIGAGYGRLAAHRNVNPYAEPGAISSATVGLKWAWRPFPLWLPSYLLCTVPSNGYGISRMRSGYMFRSDADRRRYAATSASIGAAMGLGLACVGLGVSAGARKFRAARP